MKYVKEYTEANKQESTKEFLMRLKKEFKSPEHKEHINRFLNRCRVASCGISPETAENRQTLKLQKGSR